MSQPTNDLIEPPITPEVRKWIEWHIQSLSKEAYFWLKRSNEFSNTESVAANKASDECFGLHSAYSNLATCLSYELYLLDHPFTGDVSNKNEWE